MGRAYIDVGFVAQQDTCLHHELACVASSSKYKDFAQLNILHCSPNSLQCSIYWHMLAL